MRWRVNNKRPFMFSLDLLRVLSACALAMLLAQPAHAREGDDWKSDQVPPPNDRQHETSVGEVRVTTAVPSAKETKQIFGAALYKRNIQPVWIKIENLGEETLWFLPLGLDSAYFTPIETSYRRQNRIPILNLNTNIDIYDKSMRLHINAGEVRTGYVFTRVDEGTKSFNVDIINEKGRNYLMTFFVPVPGLRLDHHDADWQDMYGPDEWRDVDLAGLISGLEALLCCVTDESGQKFGDPLNIALVGRVRDVYHAFMRAGWDETETVYRRSLFKTIASSIAGSEYRYSPVSALYVYGRAQDVALQKARSNINQRNHLRLWMTPMRYQGLPVWIGQISRDIGVRFTWQTITTHKIDPNVDETREYLLEDLAYAQSLQQFGYVKGVGLATFAEPRGNLTGDPYFTDGLRAVMFVSSEPVDISEIEVLDLGSRPNP